MTPTLTEIHPYQLSDLDRVLDRGELESSLPSFERNLEWTAEQWRSTERDLKERSGKHFAWSEAVNDLRSEADRLGKTAQEARDTCSLAVFEGRAWVQLAQVAAKEKLAFEAHREAVTYGMNVVGPAIRVAELKAKVREREAARDFHVAKALLSRLRVIIAGKGMGNGAAIDLSEHESTKLLAATRTITDTLDTYRRDLQAASVSLSIN